MLRASIAHVAAHTIGYNIHNAPINGHPAGFASTGLTIRQATACGKPTLASTCAALSDAHACRSFRIVEKQAGDSLFFLPETS
jgi:hypothetical protein